MFLRAAGTLQSPVVRAVHAVQTMFAEQIMMQGDVARGDVQERTVQIEEQNHTVAPLRRGEGLGVRALLKRSSHQHWARSRTLWRSRLKRAPLALPPCRLK